MNTPHASIHNVSKYLDAYNNLYSPPNIIRVKDEIKENVGARSTQKIRAAQKIESKSLRTRDSLAEM
jgi:hypothetical protein